MFGYVVPDNSIIKDEEYVLFNAFYCGICKQIGTEYGQLERYTTNFDITFFAVLASDRLDHPAEFAKERCVGNPLQKRPIIKSNPLLVRIARLNMIFSFYKAEDNVLDGDTGAKAVRRFLKKSYQKAAAKEPALDRIVKDGYAALRVLESAGEKSIDRVADCFAGLLRDCAAEIMGESATDLSLRLVYNVGKFVYLADALDDTGEDYKKKRYNPFLAAYGGYTGRQEFIAQNHSALTFIFATTVNRAIECFNGMDFNQSYSLLQNIVYYGLRKKTEELLASKKKLRRPSMNLKKARAQAAKSAENSGNCNGNDCPASTKSTASTATPSSTKSTANTANPAETKDENSDNNRI